MVHMNPSLLTKLQSVSAICAMDLPMLIPFSSPKKPSTVFLAVSKPPNLIIFQPISVPQSRITTLNTIYWAAVFSQVISPKQPARCILTWFAPSTLKASSLKRFTKLCANFLKSSKAILTMNVITYLTFSPSKHWSDRTYLKSKTKSSSVPNISGCVSPFKSTVCLVFRRKNICLLSKKLTI